MFKQCQEWYENRHDYARRWKEQTGGKVVGYFCSYAPEELMYAADVLPVRLLGSHETEDVTERHIVSMYCPFCRDVLAQGLNGKYDYLDGIMLSQSCLHLRQSYHSWRLHLPIEFAYNLYMPHGVQNKRAVGYLAAELQEFKKALEQWTGQTITGEKLEQATKLVNENRRLMRAIYEYRKDGKPKVTGLESMYMVLASQLTDKRDINKEMAGILAGLRGRKMERDTGVRFMIIGSENDDVAFVNMVETRGGTIVIDEHCTGSRYFWNEVKGDASEDILTRIAARYVHRVPCPSKDWPERTRLEHTMQLVKDYQVEAALVIQQKFCDPHELDIPPLRTLLEGKGIKTYMFEFDTTVPIGQFKIRLDAFMEMLQSEELPF